VCGAEIASIRSREPWPRASRLPYVEQTITCAEGHTVLRLTKLASSTMAEIVVGDRVFYRVPGGDFEIGPGTVTAIEKTDSGSIAAFVEFDPLENEGLDAAEDVEADWMDVTYLRRTPDH
jgi:hypothetical protein